MCNPGVSRWACRAIRVVPREFSYAPPLLELLETPEIEAISSRLSRSFGSHHGTHRAAQNPYVGHVLGVMPTTKSVCGLTESTLR